MPKDYQRKTENPKMGRPKIEIDQEQFEKLCGLQCTADEIASWFKCSVDTLEKWVKKTYNQKTFTDVYKIYSASGKISIRRNQFKMAEYNPSMAIFLGKQYLGQRDEVHTTINDEGSLGEILEYLKEQGK